MSCRQTTEEPKSCHVTREASLQQQLFPTALLQIYEVEVLTWKPKMKSTPLFCQVDIFLIIQHLTGMTRLNSLSSSVPLYLLHDCFKLNLTVNEIVNI